MIGTLTLGISNSTHLSINLAFFHKSYSTATPEHPRLLLQENYVCIATLTPNLQRVCFYYETDLLHYSSTIKLLLFPKHIKRLYLSSNVSHHAGDRHRPCGGCGAQIDALLPQKSIPRDRPMQFRLCHHLARLSVIRTVAEARLNTGLILASAQNGRTLFHQRGFHVADAMTSTTNSMPPPVLCRLLNTKLQSYLSHIALKKADPHAPSP
jgi:hypothetical protein